LLLADLEAIHNIDIKSLFDTTISLTTAFILGGLIGIERQYRQRTAGLRTNVLVAVGAAVFVDIGFRLAGKEGGVRGLNTAATLWGAGGVGACAGADLFLEAIISAMFVLAANTLLRPIVNVINRRPINIPSSEVTYTVSIICNQQHQQEAGEQLECLMNLAEYPISDFKVRPFTHNEVQIFAKLLRTSVDPKQLNQVIEQLMAIESVSQAYWSPSTTG